VRCEDGHGLLHRRVDDEVGWLYFSYTKMRKRIGTKVRRDYIVFELIDMPMSRQVRGSAIALSERSNHVIKPCDKSNHVTRQSVTCEVILTERYSVESCQAWATITALLVLIPYEYK